MRWTDNEKAAEFLSKYAGKFTEATEVTLPEGLGQIVQADGTIANAAKATLVPGRAGGFTSAFPIP